MTRTEQDSSGPLSFEQRVQALSPAEIDALLVEQNAELAELGVRTPIRNMVHGAYRYGHNYENRVNRQGGIRPTPMNCLMSLLHAEPTLRGLPTPEFEQLGQTISRIAIATEILTIKDGGGVWPEVFRRSPQRLPHLRA